MPLLLSCEEAARTISTSMLHLDTYPILNRDSGFFKLPAEIRERIYDLAIPRGIWRNADPLEFSREHLARGLGDPTGFYYPLSKGLSVLRVNKQMRREALPLAYRRTDFELDDLESTLKFLMAIERTGRENIESLTFNWESPCDPACEFNKDSDGDCYWTLPRPFTARCVQLLKQSKRLRHLRLGFKSELALNMTSADDSDVQDLCSLQHMAKLQIRDLDLESMESCDIAKMIQQKIGGQN